MTLWEMLRRSAERHRDKTAVLFRGEAWSYARLFSSAQDLGCSLRGLHVGRGDRVAVMLPNSPAFILAYFAIQAAGAVVVPVNVLLKPEELAYLLEDSEASLILSIRPFYPVIQEARKLLASKVKAVLFEPEEAGLEEGDLSFGSLLRLKGLGVSGPADPEDVAAGLYTSGTTGRPKGAMLTHRNLLSNIDSFAQVAPWDERDVLLCVLPLFHSFAQTCLMLFPLSVGATVVLEPKFVPDQILQLIAQRQVTLFAGVPAMYAVWAQMPALNLDFSSWRFCVSGGAALSPEVLERFEAKYPVRIYEGYGPTECSPVLTVNPFDLERRKVGSVGLPIPGVAIKIVDEAGRELPRGEVGEIIARGPNVMKGYWRRPQETAEVLKDGWFYTGDLGRMDEEGYVYIVDRKKDLIIVGGLNIYPREVEEVLLAHPKVAEAAVIGIKDPIKGEKVKAVLVLKEGQEGTAKEIREHCRKSLAPFKIPRHIEFRASLPKTATGKVAKPLLRQE